MKDPRRLLGLLSLFLALVPRADSQQAQSDELVYLIQQGTYEDVVAYLENEVDVNVGTPATITPLESAVGCHISESAFSNPDTRSINRVRTAPWITSLLLAAGANPNRKNARGSTPLECAVYHNDLGSAWLLLHYGGNPNEQNTLGMTPLMYAADHCFKDMIALLLEHGGSRDLANVRRETAISIGETAGCSFDWTR